MNYRLLLFIPIAISAFASALSKGPQNKVLTDSVQIHFRQSKVNVDTSYMHNDASFAHVKNSILLNNRPDSNFVLLDVKVVGGASPEGSVKFNDWLSHQRAARIFDYMRSRMIIPDSLTSTTFLGRDWEGLRAMVEADPGVPDREEVLSTLDEIIEKYRRGEKESDGNVARLKAIHHGIPYLYLYNNLFPTLRESKIVLTFGHAHPLLTAENLSILPCDSPLLPTGLLLPPIMPETKCLNPFYMAIKTNLIADALALPELGVEFYLGKNLSIVGNWMYGWWDKDSSHRYWRAYGGDLALRWWFGKAAHEKPLTGHHLGIYGGVVTYDFEFGGKGWMGGRPGHNLWDRCMHYAGIEYGYSLPIARRLNLDFTLGLGYLGGKYVEYKPDGKCYAWEATKIKHWVGPTKAEISLTWLIGRCNYNEKKGGSK